MPRVECKVCGERAHGMHFGVLACRACAAFFRRTIVQRLKYACRENDDCIISKADHSMCRSCRYRKCLALGMDANGVQQNRDTHGPRPNGVPKPKKQPREKESVIVTNPSPENGRLTDSYESTSSSTHLRDRLEEIFVQVPPSDLCNVPNIGVLYRLLLAYRRFGDRRATMYKDQGLPERTRYPRQRQLTGIVEKYRNHQIVEGFIIDLFCTADFVMALESFQILPLDQKMLVFKRFWARFITLHRMSQRYESEYAEYERNKALVAAGEQVEGLMSQGDVRLEEIRMRVLVTPLHRLKANDIELMAMVGNLLWSIAARDGISDETLELARQQRTRCFDELHAHYIGERPHASLMLYGEPATLPNYAMRVTLMSDIVNALDQGIMQTKEDFNVLRLFDAMTLPEAAQELLELID